MIIYERDKKELIVPATFAGGGDSNCGPAIERAYEEGWQSGWTEGYASGSSECSGCTLQEGGYFAPLWPELPTGVVDVFPDEGYDGFSKFSVNDGAALWSFHAAGVEAGREEGWNEGFASGWTEGFESGSSMSCNLQEGRYYVPVWPNGSSGEVNILPDEGYDGFSNFRINDWDGLWSYYSAGSESVRSQFTTLNVSGNGIYECSGDAAYNVVNVNIPQSYRVYLSGTIITDHDIVYDGNYNKISVLIQGESNTIELQQGYMGIDGINGDNMIGRTLTAGTHTFYAAVNEWTAQWGVEYFEPWWTEVLVFENGTGVPAIGNIRVCHIK